MDLMGKEEVLYKFNKSRKAYLPEYLSGFLLLVILGYLYSQNTKVSSVFTFAVLGISLFSIGSAEFSRMMNKYLITSTKLIIIKGLLKQYKKNVYFYSLGFVSDINVHQGRMQRLLNYGSISVSGAGSDAFVIKDINKPKHMMEHLEEMIKKNRKSTHKDKES